LGKVLVVCGTEQSAELVEFLARRYEVAQADSFDRALQMLQRERFQLVISERNDFLPLERAAVAEQTAVILETIGQGVGIIDLAGEIVWSNRRLEDLSKDLLRRMTDRCLELFAREIRNGRGEPSTRRFTLTTADDRYLEVSASLVVDADGHFQHIAVAVWDATASRQMQRKLNAIDNAGRELVRLDSEIVDKMEIPERLQLLEERIIRYTREILGFDKFSIRLVDKRTNRLELVLSAGLSEQAKHVDLFVSSEGNGISGYVAATGRSYICPDVRRDRRYMHGIDRAASSLTVPLLLSDEVVGVFNVESERPAAFDEDDRQFAEIFGRYVAMTLHILDLLVVERYRTKGQFADNVSAEIAAPLNDILTDATAMMEEYIGHDDLRHRLQAVCDNVATIRSKIRDAGRSDHGLLGGKPKEAVVDEVLADKSVLVADDEPVIRQTITDVLRKHGCEVDSARDGNEAICMIEQHHYDVVLSDIKLPYKTGYQIFAAVKGGQPHVPVIFMTAFGYDPHHSIVRAHQEGLAGVLYKPFKVDQLLNMIREALTAA